jgi:hypothetical protein
MLKVIKILIIGIILLVLTSCEKDKTKNTSSNKSPIAKAGRDRIINFGSTVTLDASKSYDRDGYIIDYLWSENDVELSYQKSFSTSDFSVGKHKITLTVSDNDKATNSDIVMITVKNKEEIVSNKAPIAKAGKDQNIEFGSTVTLNASNSYDNDGYIINYIWSENGVELSKQKNFSKNNFSIGKHILILKVTDNDNNTDTDVVIVTVRKKKVINQNFNLDLKYDRMGTVCNNDRYCTVDLYRVKIEGNRWTTTTKIKFPYTAKKGEVLFIGFGNYFTKPTLLDFSHNIPKEDIISNKLSLSPKDRPSKQWIVFRMNQDISFNMKITQEINTKISAFCADNSSRAVGSQDYANIYKLDEYLEKSYFIKSAGYYLNYDTKVHNNNDNLLIECYNNRGSFLYSGIVHITKNEFWNFRSSSIANRNYYGSYKVGYLTDLYFKGYKKFIKDGLEPDIAKEKATKKVKSIFKDYTSEYIGETFYTYNGTTYAVTKSISKSLSNQFDFIEYYYRKNSNYISRRKIIDSIFNYLFNQEYIDDYLKVNFFQNKIKLLSKNNFFNSNVGWKKIGTTENKHAEGNIFIDDKNILNITLTSNRQRYDALSLFKMQQTVNIENFDKSNLYFKASIKQIYGKEENGQWGMNDCSGMAGITLAYLDKNNNTIGHTSIVNMDDSIILGTDFYGNPQTPESTDFRHIIKTNDIKEYRAVVLNIKDEVENIPNITSVNEINKIQMILFTSDYFTEGDRYYWDHKIVSNCRDAKAFLKVSEAGIYKIIN